jgi:hypothetical protein
MSERGSFVTEYIYCDKCLEEAKKVLLDRHKYLCSEQVSAQDGSLFPVIAGKVGGSWSGCEVFEFENDWVPMLEKKLCCPMRIAVLGESGEQIFNVVPSNEEER